MSRIHLAMVSAALAGAFAWTSCAPDTISYIGPTCLEGGWVIHQERGHDCAIYGQFAAQSWALLVSRGWVNPDSKPAVQRIELYVHDSWSFACGDRVAAGCFEGGRIETNVALSALAHEWLHRVDLETGVSLAQDGAHHGWWTLGAGPGDAWVPSEGQTPAYLAGSWFGATRALQEAQTAFFAERYPQG